jgi:sigma-54 dependent transcriptional regulator, acetoin dehydrogenase operon transcriptional activator AcoR
LAEIRTRKEIRFARLESGTGVLPKIKNISTPTEDDLYEYRGKTFLDEIDSIPMDLQSKLLRIIQEKEVYISGEDQIRKFQSKIICATNKDPRLMEKGSVLIEDLLYRVSRGIVEVPPLRNMKESIPEITYFIIRNDQFNLGMGEKRRKSIELSSFAFDKLFEYNWPGNHRELENVIYRALKKSLFEKRSMCCGQVKTDTFC